MAESWGISCRWQPTSGARVSTRMGAMASRLRTSSRLAGMVSGGWAPRRPGMRKGPSRCTPSMRAAPAGRSAIEPRIAASAWRMASSWAVKVVPSIAVVPWRAWQRAIVTQASPPCMMSAPPAPCTCRSIKPGTMVRPAPAPSSALMAAMRSPNSTVPLIQPAGVRTFPLTRISVRDQQFDSQRQQTLAVFGADGGVGDDGMDPVELHDAVQADAAEFRGIGEHDDFLGPFNHLVIEARFGLVMGGQSLFLIEPATTEEQFVEAVGLQAGFGLGSLDRQRLLAQVAAGQDQVDAGGVGQLPGDVQAVGQDGHALGIAQVAGQRNRGRARVDDDVVACFDEGGRERADAFLLLVMNGVLLADRVFRRRRARQVGAAVAARDQALRLQRRQVISDRDGGNAQLGDKLADLHRAFFGQQAQDRFAALAGMSHGRGSRLERARA